MEHAAPAACACLKQHGEAAAHGLTAGRLASRASTCASSSSHSLESRNCSSLQGGGAMRNGDAESPEHGGRLWMRKLLGAEVD